MNANYVTSPRLSSSRSSNRRTKSELYTAIAGLDTGIIIVASIAGVLALIALTIGSIALAKIDKEEIHWSATIQGTEMVSSLPPTAMLVMPISSLAGTFQAWNGTLQLTIPVTDNVATVDGGASFGVSFWTQASDAWVAEGDFELVRVEQDAQPDKSFGLRVLSGLASVEFFTFNNSTVIAQLPFTLQAGEWYHVAYSHDQVPWIERDTLFINGAKVAGAPTPAFAPNGGVGGSHVTLASWSTSPLQDVRLYKDQSLTAMAVNWATAFAAWNGGYGNLQSDASNANLRAHFPLTEGDGSTIARNALWAASNAAPELTGLTPTWSACGKLAVSAVSTGKAPKMQVPGGVGMRSDLYFTVLVPAAPHSNGNGHRTLRAHLLWSKAVEKGGAQDRDWQVSWSVNGGDAITASFNLRGGGGAVGTVYATQLPNWLVNGKASSVNVRLTRLATDSDLTPVIVEGVVVSSTNA